MMHWAPLLLLARYAQGLFIAVIGFAILAACSGNGSPAAPSDTLPCYQRYTCSGSPQSPCLNCWESNIVGGCCPANTPFLCSGDNKCYASLYEAGVAASRGGFTCVAPAYRSCS